MILKKGYVLLKYLKEIQTSNGIIKVGEELQIKYQTREDKLYVDEMIKLGYAKIIQPTPATEETKKKEIKQTVKEKKEIIKYDNKDEAKFDKIQAEREEIEIVKHNVYMFLLNKCRREATEEIVQWLRTNNRFIATRNDVNNELWIYDNGIYKPEGKTYIQENCRIILESAYTTQISNEVIAKIEADSYMEQELFFNQQNQYPHLVPVETGILNIKTKRLEGFTPKIYFFNKLPIIYNPKKKCPNFLNFLEEIVKDLDDIKIIQELFGYCLYKKYKYKKAFMFEGSGDNGKSQLLKILTEKFLGVENTKELSLEKIEKNQYIVSELQNKLANVSPDITQGVLDNTGIFKNLTGGDLLSCERKFKTTINFFNYAKMIFATNELPITKDNSSGFWGRWILLEFPHRFLSQKEIDQLPFEEKKNVKLAIPNVLDQICTEDELSGILNWALEGFERLEKNKEFSYQNSISDVKLKWSRKANSVLAFINENIEEDYDSYIIKEDFKRRYLQYCSKHNLKRKNDKVIMITLENEMNAYSERKVILNEQKYVWSGIRFATLATFATHFDPIEKKQLFSLEPKRVATIARVASDNVLSSIKIIFDFLQEIKVTHLISKLGEKKPHYISFPEYELSIENAINELKEEGFLVEMPKGTLRRL